MTVLALVLSVSIPGAPPATAAAEPSWCADSPVMVLGGLPAEMPWSRCELGGRVVAQHPGGVGAVVPPSGYAVAASAGDSTITIWSDDYAVHVGESTADAMLRYAARLPGAPPGEDRVRQAKSLARYVEGSAGIAAPTLDATAGVLDRTGEVERWAESDREGDAPFDALSEVRDYVLAVARNGRDDRPDVASLKSEVERALGRASARAEVPRAQASRDLATMLILRGYAAGLERSAYRADITGMTGIVRAYRDAISMTAPSVRLPAISDDARRAAARLAWTLASPAPGAYTEDYLPDATSPAACADTARAYLFPDTSPPGRWPRGYRIDWSYNYTNQFPRYSATGYSQALSRAFNGVTGLSDDCGFTWHPDLYNRFAGFTTTVTPNASSGYCRPDLGDWNNVVGWSPVMPASPSGSSYYAYACVVRDVSTNLIFDSDVVMSTRTQWDIPELDGSIGYSCNVARGDLDVQSGMSHEFGHAVGLDHVDEATHGRLTMSPQIDAACQRHERTLGRGDAIGLSSLYGQV